MQLDLLVDGGWQHLDLAARGRGSIGKAIYGAVRSRYRYKNLLADHTQGGKDNSFKQQPLAGVLSQAEIDKEGGSGWVFRGRT